jgi:hypothetical protein
LAAHLTSQLAVARLLDDKQGFLAALYGGEGASGVNTPWVALFDHVVYGPSDRPLLRVTPNNGPDPLTSKPAYSTPVVAAGKINDRYRNDNPLQGIGYPMGTLEWLFDAAEILRIAGFNPYAYRGAHQQSIEMAAQYYACYGQHVGFYKTVTHDNARACPDYQEYVGRIVNDVEPAVLIRRLSLPAKRLDHQRRGGGKNRLAFRQFSRCRSIRTLAGLSERGRPGENGIALPRCSAATPSRPLPIMTFVAFFVPAIV